ncbi:MAG TPA: zinc-binding dehydrogenase [Candidatus Angelobacter sp.]|nr:zinc-binding dehydrogenase [Candidatus Angelobacter sp.]
MSPLPATMRAVQLRDYDGKPDSLAVAEVPVPRPGPGEVLVKVFASPVNPSDLMFITGNYGFKKPLPATPGFEGSGTVVETGSGFMAKFMSGRRVACAAADAKATGGLWAEYVVTSAQFCVPLGKKVEMEHAATMLVNPLTAWALVDVARKGGHRAAVHTAAASALGQMVVRLGKRFGLPIINVVRRAEQVQLLRSLGAAHVLNSGESGFDDELRKLCHQLGATISFEAIAGDMSARVLTAQPVGSRMLVYGGLSLKPVEVDAGSLIFEKKHVEGFWLSAWLAGHNLLSRLRVARQVQSMLSGDLKTEIRARLPLEKAAEGLAQYAAHMTGGKVLIVP